LTKAQQTQKEQSQSLSKVAQAMQAEKAQFYTSGGTSVQQNGHDTKVRTRGLPG